MSVSRDGQFLRVEDITIAVAAEDFPVIAWHEGDVIPIMIPVAAEATM